MQSTISHSLLGTGITHSPRVRCVQLRWTIPSFYLNIPSHITTTLRLLLSSYLPSSNKPEVYIIITLFDSVSLVDHVIHSSLGRLCQLLDSVEEETISTNKLTSVNFHANEGPRGFLPYVVDRIVLVVEKDLLGL